MSENGAMTVSGTKKLSNPFSTGGGGPHFENHVQASFVILMLTGGYAPGLPCDPVIEISLQGKVDGFQTDDCIVYTECAETKERRKMLVQIKHRFSFTKRNKICGEVICAAWQDFNNGQLFVKGKDVIAVITESLGAANMHHLKWMLDQARCTRDADEFFRTVQESNFSPSGSSEKLDAMQYHLKNANGGREVPKEDVYNFLKHFQWFGYDLGREHGVVLSLLHSHMSQIQTSSVRDTWSRVVDAVATWNQNGGTMTPANLPEDIREAFKPKIVVRMPQELFVSNEEPKTDWGAHADALWLAQAVLIGAWDEANDQDVGMLNRMFGIEPAEWVKKAREVLHAADSPLSVQHGCWKIKNRSALWHQVGDRLLEGDVLRFREIAATVLQKVDRAFDLSSQGQIVMPESGSSDQYSAVLRKGLAEGLAVLTNNADVCRHYSRGRIEAAGRQVVHDVLDKAGWAIWASLRNELPALAEAAPDEWLEAVEGALKLQPCPFVEMMQNGSVHCFSGLMCALEGLAWEERYFVRACAILGELAALVPGDSLSNHAMKSLTAILLPWYPQTLVPAEKRKIAVETIGKEWPTIGWKLMLELLPSQHPISSHTYRPKWRKSILEEWNESVTKREYWDQSLCYAEMSIRAAGSDAAKIVQLLDCFSRFPRPAFEQLLDVCSSQDVLNLAEDQRAILWERLSECARLNRRFDDAEWALPEDAVAHIERVATLLEPSSPMFLYPHLFGNGTVDLLDGHGDFEEQELRLHERQKQAVEAILQHHGMAGIRRFAEKVEQQFQLGCVLSSCEDRNMETDLLPHGLSDENAKIRMLTAGFVGQRFKDQGWQWCEVLDRSAWTMAQSAAFLTYLPFDQTVWIHVKLWLGKHEDMYWTTTNAYRASDNAQEAVDKLLAYGRPDDAIACLYRMLQGTRQIDVNQCARVLIQAFSGCRAIDRVDNYSAGRLIKFLQASSEVSHQKMCEVEWACLPLLDHYSGRYPQFLERKLAQDPGYFCDLINLCYNKENRHHTEASEEEATRAWKLLERWKRPPGMQDDDQFDSEQFKEWIRYVEGCRMGSRQKDIAFHHLGEVLIYSPADPDGLWIHRTVAEVLNASNHEEMRHGYKSGLYYARGAHFVDPSGKPEKALAGKFRKQADEVENACFHRLANTLRQLADSYDVKAERVRSEHAAEIL